ncbi:MAG TPA: extracellular solute-binding protein [Bacillota bacterium]|nr:extracellular solute-binding protein [Bacillota bacterium]
MKNCIVRYYFFIALLLLIFLSACSSGGGDSETVHFYSPETPDMTKELKKLYEEQNPDATVEVEYAGTNPLVNKMIAEKQNPNADVWYGGGGFLPFEQAKDEGIMTEFTPELAEDWDVVENDIQMKDEEGMWTGAEIFVLGFAYNTEMVDEDEAPKTWDDLLDPKWEGQIEMPNPAASGTATLLVMSQMMDRGEEEAWEYFDKLNEQVSRMPDSGAQPTKDVAKGEAAIAIGFSFMAYEQKLENNENVDFVVPEKTPVLVNPVTLIKDGPHPESGKKFINFLLSEEAQEILADWYHIPINPNVEAKTPLSLNEVKEHAMELDVEWAAENLDRVRKEWDERY